MRNEHHTLMLMSFSRSLLAVSRTRRAFSASSSLAFRRASCTCSSITSCIRLNTTPLNKLKEKRRCWSPVDPDPGFQVFFKNCNLLFHKLLRGRPSYRRSHQPTKENIQHFKKCNLLTFFLLLWSNFVLLEPDLDPNCESGYGYGSRDPIDSGSSPDPDPQQWL
jgi:hypothetical protein